MPTINKPFLLKLVLVVAALGGLLAGVHTLQASRIPDALKRQADRAADAGKTEVAIHYLRQYLEFAPDDADTQEKLAELIRKRGASPRGQSELVFLYDKILRTDPARHHVRRDALALCLKLGRFSDAVTHAEALLEAFPADAAVWQQLGAARTGLNQLPEARRAYETAITHAPGEMIGYQRLAQLLWKNLNNPGDARAVLDRMVAAMPQEPHAYLVRARFEAFLAEEAGRGTGQPVNLDPTLRDLRRVIELDPENADAALLLAEILQKGRDVPAAHAVLRDAVGLYPRDLRLVRSLAWLELVRGNVPASMAVLEDGVKNSVDGFDLLVPLADLLIQQGDTTRTADMVKRIEARIPTLPTEDARRSARMQVKYLRARVAMRQAKWAEAVGLLDALRAEATRLPGLEAQLNLLLAACHRSTADADAEEKAYRRVTGADPANVPARVGLATLYLNQGKFDDAAREYEAAAQSAYAPGTVYAQWVRLKARQLRQGGGSPDEWRKLEQVATNAAPKFGPVSSEGMVLRADVAAAQGKYAEAVQLLRKETARRPGDTRLWAVLAETTADGSGTAAGLAVMDEAQAAAGDGPEVRLARARLYGREPGRVRPIDPLAERVDTWAEADQLRLLSGLVEVYDEIGDRASVVRTLKRIAARRPAELAVWVRLHERAVAAGDEAAAAEARAAVRKIDGDNGLSLLVCDATSGKDPRAADRLVAAFGASPDRADACLALAKLKADAGDDKEALRLTERAFALEPTRYETARSLLVSMCRTGSGDRAAQILARLSGDPRWAGEPFRRLARGVVEQVPPASAPTVLAWCKPLVERDPGGPGWLAECYTAVGKPAEAETVLAAAVRVPTATADDWLRLACSHAAAGRKDAAGDTLKTARAQLKPPAFFAIAAVFRHTPNGNDWLPVVTDPAEMRVFTQARLAVKLSRSEPAEGAKVLEEFLDRKDLPATDANWARRNLAMLYALGGTPADRERAVGLIKDAQVDGKSGPEELRATASVLTTLARYLEGPDRQAVLTRAAAALEAAHQVSKSPRDLYHLSQLHRAAGNRAESRKGLQLLLNADPKNIYYLVAALEEVTESGDFQAGVAFATFLLANHPGEFRAVAAVARFECKAGRPEKAIALAEGYAGAADASAGDYLTRAARVAELLDELARYPNVRGTPAGRKMADAAVDRYAALVPARPEAVVAIAGVLAADGRTAEAFAKLDQFDRYLPKQVRALAGLAAVRAGGVTDRQADTARGWLDESLEADRESVPLQLNKAEFLALRQDLKGAVDLYEKVLRRDPRNVVALNNLAWILAADPQTAVRALELVDRATREVGLTGELLDTRARVKITLKQFDKAERDLAEAIRQEPTPLRWFHVALLKESQAPPNPAEAGRAFREARARGLDPKAIHPADLPVYRVLEGRPPGN